MVLKGGPISSRSSFSSIIGIDVGRKREIRVGSSSARIPRTKRLNIAPRFRTRCNNGFSHSNGIISVRVLTSHTMLNAYAHLDSPMKTNSKNSLFTDDGTLYSRLTSWERIYCNSSLAEVDSRPVYSDESEVTMNNYEQTPTPSSQHFIVASPSHCSLPSTELRRAVWQHGIQSNFNQSTIFISVRFCAFNSVLKDRAWSWITWSAVDESGSWPSWSIFRPRIL